MPAAARASTCAACPLEESGLAPKEIWCNESQERYVLAIAPQSLPQFQAFCERERCPFAVVGMATEERQLVVGGPQDLRRGHAHGRASRQTAQDASRREERETRVRAGGSARA